jgi:two-component system, NtrC family, sensor kinase
MGEQRDSAKSMPAASAGDPDVHRDRLPAALVEKAFAAERRLAGFRIAVLICNTALYFAFIRGRPEASPRLALAVIVLAFSYGLYVLIAEPYRRFSIFKASYFVSTADALATMAWIHATGGVRSPFFLLLYLLPIGAAYRHRFGEAIVASTLFAAAYAGLLAARGELLANLPDVAPRIVYTFLSAGIGLLLAHEIVEQAVGRLELAARARAEDARLRLAAIVDSSGDAIVGLARDGTVESWNASASQVFGWSFDEVVAKPAEILLAPEQWALVADILARVRGGEIVEQVETVGVHKDGRAVGLALVASPIRDARGEIGGIALIARDVTERKDLEARLLVSERMASVGTMAAGFAHEISSPLSHLMSSLDAVAERLRELGSSLPRDKIDEVSGALAMARDGAGRVGKVVGDLRMFSGIGDDRNGPVDVRRVLDSIVDLAWNEISRRARLVKEYGEVPLVHANESRLAQALLNLVVNAAQSIPEGQAERNEIRILTREGTGGRVAIEIHDTGRGIADEDRARIFEPFSTSRPAGAGSGLGLSVCHSIVTLLGGKIEIDSEVGSGSVFRVLLPVAPS